MKSLPDAPGQDEIAAKNPSGESARQTEIPSVHVVSELQIPAAVINEYRTGERKKARRERWMLRIQILTLLVLGIYTAVTYELLRETARNNTMTGSAYKSAEAAQLGTVGVQMDFDDPSGVAAWITLANSGRTTSTGVTLTVNAYVPFDWGKRPAAATVKPYVGRFDFGLTPMPPGREMLPARIPFALPASEKERARTFGIVLHGEIGFDDGFGTRRNSTFCLFYDPRPKVAEWSLCSPMAGPVK